jgi:hypothetical protein
MPNLLKLATKTLRPRRNYKRIQEMLFSTHKNKLPKKKTSWESAENWRET